MSRGPRSGTHAELRHRAQRLDRAADKIIERHRSNDSATGEADWDSRRRAQVQALHQEAQATRDFLARTRRGATARAANSSPT